MSAAQASRLPAQHLDCHEKLSVHDLQDFLFFSVGYTEYVWPQSMSGHCRNPDLNAYRLQLILESIHSMGMLGCIRSINIIYKP